jgi:hypothetical protein
MSQALYSSSTCRKGVRGEERKDREERQETEMRGG